MVRSRPALLTVLVMFYTAWSDAAAADAVDVYVGASLGLANSNIKAFRVRPQSTPRILGWKLGSTPAYRPAVR